MSARTLLAAFLWLTSLVLVATIARAQALPGAEVKVLSGDDIGFRVESTHGKTPVGSIVVRWNGQWVEPKWTQKVMPITR